MLFQPPTWSILPVNGKTGTIPSAKAFLTAAELDVVKKSPVIRLTTPGSFPAVRDDGAQIVGDDHGGVE
jgi:hypothetical protein